MIYFIKFKAFLKSTFRALLEQFQSSFGTDFSAISESISEQFPNSFRATLEQFQSSFSFRAVLEQLQSNFRAISEQFWN